MTNRDKRRLDAIERMADHLLLNGMNAASLRTLAAAAGTSDRMLLYYFADKEDLITATLGKIADRLTALLDGAIPIERQLLFADLLDAIWRIVGSPKLRPYMRLWLELAAAAARKEEPHTTIASGIMDGFVNWTGNHVAREQGASHEESTAMLLAVIEGALFLDAIGRRDLADMAVRCAAQQRR